MTDTNILAQMPRQNAIWAGIAIFSLALITYYIYFLDVNECIVEMETSEDYYLESKQEHNKHINKSINSHKDNTTTEYLAECPQVDVTTLCSNFCRSTNGTTNNTNNINNTQIIIGNNHNANTSSTCVNTTIVINGSFPGDNNCSSGVGYVVPGVAVLIEPRSLFGYVDLFDFLVPIFYLFLHIHVIQ